MPAGQAHKELFHNEALLLVDFLLQPLVKAIAYSPSALSPVEGDCWLIGVAPVDEWENRGNQIAAWSAGGWRYIPPVQSMQIMVQDENRKAYFDGSEWLSVEPIALPDGGVTVDEQARLAIDSILLALQTHGIVAAIE